MRQALVVGINDYPTAPLTGCVADADRISALLMENDDCSPNFDVRRLTKPNEVSTKALLRKNIEELFVDSKADIALFYFSGHGWMDATGGYFVTPDAAAYDEGLSMELVIGLANSSTARERIVIIDCCHAGAFGNSTAVASGASVLAEGVSILTASRKSEAAVERNGQGVFTCLICDGLEGGASDVRGRVTAASLYSYVDEALGAWSQRPLFKTHASRFTPLRACKPVVPFELLRLIPTYFADPDSEFALDPTYEPYSSPLHPEHEAIFGHLQKYRNARLLEPVGAEHMYFAAMQSLSCRLTPLGRQYWRLAKEKHL
jgi:hypothetical protein